MINGVMNSLLRLFHKPAEPERNAFVLRIPHARFLEIVRAAPPAVLSEREINHLVHALKTNQRPVYGGNGRDVYLTDSLSTVLAIFGEALNDEQQIQTYGGKCKTLFATWGKLVNIRDEALLQAVRRAVSEVLGD